MRLFCTHWLTARKFFTLICSLLTVFLLAQEVYNFAITRPTSTAKEEEQLKASDIPDVVVCPEPGFNSSAFEKHGYLQLGTYYRGSMDGDKFVGWNGDGKKSSQEILENVLSAGRHFQSLMSSASFRQDNTDYVGAEIEVRTFAYPQGRCLSFSPPKKSLNSTRINSLVIVLNETTVEKLNFKSFKLWVYFMDRSSSLQIYPDEMENLGDPVRMDMFYEKPPFITFKIQISRSIHVPGDPLLDCAIYTTDNSYHKCVKKDLINTFAKEIGCMPPLLEEDPKLICNKKFNVSKKRDNEINRLFRSLYYHDRKFNCRTPCTKNIYTSRFVHSVPSRFKSNTLVLVFDKTIEVARSSFSIDGQTLLTRLGGSVSSGRTLVWIILTILAASQVGFYLIILKVTQYILFLQVVPRCQSAQTLLRARQEPLKSTKDHGALEPRR